MRGFEFIFHLLIDDFRLVFLSFFCNKWIRHVLLSNFIKSNFFIGIFYHLKIKKNFQSLCIYRSVHEVFLKIFLLEKLIGDQKNKIRVILFEIFNKRGQHVVESRIWDGFLILIIEILEDIFDGEIIENFKW